MRDVKGKLEQVKTKSLYIEKLILFNINFLSIIFKFSAISTKILVDSFLVP